MVAGIVALFLNKGVDTNYMEVGGGGYKTGEGGGCK